MLFVVTEYFYHDPKFKLILSSLHQFGQTFMSAARRLFPCKYHQKCYINFICTCFCPKMMSIGMKTGFMPSSYSQQGVECTGTDVGKQCEFTANGKIDTLPPKSMNANPEIVDDDEAVDLEECKKNYLNSLHDRVSIHEYGNWDHNAIDLRKNVFTQRQSQQMKLKTLDCVESVADNGWKFNIPHVLDLKFFEKEVNKCTDW